MYDGTGYSAMIKHRDINDKDLRKLIRQNKIRFGGNKKLKIYGTLACKSGKKMKKENRVFFISEKKATKQGYRPCGHCMKIKYQQWKRNSFNYKKGSLSSSPINGFFISIS